jgi:hypothetical protein
MTLTTTSLGGVVRPMPLGWTAVRKQYRYRGMAREVRLIDRAGGAAWTIIDGWLYHAYNVTAEERRTGTFGYIEDVEVES